MGYLVFFLGGFSCGFLVREFISRRRRSHERSRRYSSEMDAGPAPVERRLEPLTEKEIPPFGRSRMSWVPTHLARRDKQPATATNAKAV